MVFCIIGFYYENEEKGMDKMARKTKYEIRTLKTETDDVNQYNALLRYAFQVTEQEPVSYTHLTLPTILRV